MDQNPSAIALQDRQFSLFDQYHQIRATTESLCQGLKPEDTVAQSMNDASPVKWHLAHTTWFFETLVLEKALPDFVPVDPQYRVMFNSYYNSVGEQYLRPQRGLISRPLLSEVMEYRKRVDEQLAGLLQAERTLSESLLSVIEIGLHHEQQHQELILTDLKHLFSFNPLHPVYCEISAHALQQTAPLHWRAFDAGLYTVGHGGAKFSYDNETPQHQVYLKAFEIGSRPITNGEYIQFIQDNGYQCPELWLSDAWSLLKEQHWQSPLYWQQRDGEWHSYTLAGLRPVCEDEPVTHISYYEADAYARWAGARLPTEYEWELAAAQQPGSGNFLERRCFHPVAANPGNDLQQLFGDVWEWTQSAYAPYPGYQPQAGELAEYNGKFMCNQMVLRGGSCVTPRSHIRATYRNFFYPQARWQFSGIRLARDVA